MHTCLEQALGLAHGRLEVQGADVLPVLLQQRHQEVDAHLTVHVQLLHRSRKDASAQALTSTFPAVLRNVRVVTQKG